MLNNSRRLEQIWAANDNTQHWSSKLQFSRGAVSSHKMDRLWQDNTAKRISALSAASRKHSSPIIVSTRAFSNLGFTATSNTQRRDELKPFHAIDRGLWGEMEGVEEE